MNKVTILNDANLRELALYFGKSESEITIAILSAFERNNVLFPDELSFCGMTVSELAAGVGMSIAPLSLISFGRSNRDINRLLKSLTIWGDTDEDETCPDCGCGIDWERSEYEEREDRDPSMVTPPEYTRTVTNFVCSNPDCAGSLLKEMEKILRP